MTSHETETNALLRALGTMDARALRLVMRGAAPAYATRAAVSAVQRRFWGFEPVDFADAVYRVLTLGASERSEFLRAIRELKEPPDDATRLLRAVFRFFLDNPQLVDERDAWERWFTSWAGPNQAEAVAEHFTYCGLFWRKGELVPAREVVLMRWMVDNGVATLLDSHWGDAIRALLVCADAAGDAEREAVVGTLLRSRALDVVLQEDVEPARWLWPALERASSSRPGEAAVLGALHRSGRVRSSLRARSVANEILGNRRDEEASRLAEFPGLRALVETWISAVGGVGAALVMTFADELRMLPVAPGMLATYRTALDDSLRIAFSDLGDLVARPQVVDALLLLGQAAATTDVVRARVDAVDARAVVLANRDPEVVRLLLASKEHASVAAAVAYLATAAPDTRSRLSVDEADALAEHFSRIARAMGGMFPTAESARLLRGVESVSLVETCSDPDLVVERDGPNLNVSSRATFARLLQEFGEHRGVQVACLYFAHEVVHHLQGIARKAMVTEIRKHGSEGVVVRLDLEADMLAIRAVARASDGSWSLAELLDRTLEGLEAFPATLSHAAVSSERKSIRFASLLFTKALGRLDEGYVVLDLPPFAGEACLIRVSGIECVERAFPVMPDDVRWLRALAHEAENLLELGEIEARCGRLLCGAVRGG